MFGTILQRTIMVELLRVFFITLVSLTGLFLLGGLVAEASNRGLAPAQVLTLMPLMIPSTLPYTIPATTLFASCNVYGRMAKDNEIIALRAAGLNVWSILKPSILLGAMASVATMALYYQTIPASFERMREHLVGDVNEMLITVLKRQGCFKHPKLPYVVFAREVHGDRLKDVIFKRKMPNSINYDTVARAREAVLRVETRTDPETGLPASYILMDMSQCVVCSQAKPDAKPDVVQFQNKEFLEKLPAEMFGDKGSPRSSDVSWPRLLTMTEEYKQEEIARARLIDADALRVRRMPNPPKSELEELSNKRNVQRYRMRIYRSFEAEKQLRPALALGCLCFVLLGGPIGIWANRADFLSSFVIGFLPVVVIYYPLLICLTNLAKEGKVPIAVAAWGPDALFASVALTLVWRLVRR